MKKSLIVIGLLIFQVGAVFAQKIKFDPEFHERLAQREKEKLDKIILCEQEKTANQGDYDIKYYSLDLIPDPATEILTGKVEIVGEVLVSTLDHVELNLIGNMNVTDVYLSSYPNDKLSYTHENDPLALDNIVSVNLDSIYLHGQIFSFVVEYNGTPLYGYGFDSYRGAPTIWTLSEPYGARAWWPCKDIPSDKADSVDIRVTVPSGLIVASNGTLREMKRMGNQTMFWWHEKYPIVSYLVSLAIHPYTVRYDDYIYNNGADTMKIHFYMFADHGNELQPLNALVKDMIAFFSDIYGEYPFIDEKYGHADYLGGGAMEHQTCTSFSFWGEWFFAHELSHQWWGDMITCDSWHHIWLNEGFACYSEILWFEHVYGHELAMEYLLSVRTYLGRGTIYVEDPLNEPILDLNLSYNKACWVLHMLRHVVGDSAFFDILKAYYASEYRYKTAKTEDFQAICEQVSGMNLDYFFQQWIYESGHPVYEFAWESENLGSGNYKVTGYIDQVQTDGPIFKMLLDITVMTIDSTLITQTFFVDEQGESFEILCSVEPVAIILDIGNWVLKEVIECNAPKIVYQNHIFDDSGGNSNGHWDEGEIIQLTLELNNIKIIYSHSLNQSHFSH